MDNETLIAEIESVVAKLEAMKQGLLKTQPVFPSWAEELVNSRICLLCRESIGEERSVRGNHARHAKAVMRAIERGEITEVEAVETGKLAPKSTSGRKVKPLAELVDEATNSEKSLKKLPSRTAKKKGSKK
jgi:hypothetical protein